MSDLPLSDSDTGQPAVSATAPALQTALKPQQPPQFVTQVHVLLVMLGLYSISITGTCVTY